MKLVDPWQDVSKANPSKFLYSQGKAFRARLGGTRYGFNRSGDPTSTTRDLVRKPKLVPRSGAQIRAQNRAEGSISWRNQESPLAKAMRLPTTPRLAQALRSPGRGRPAGPVTGAVRRNQPANPAIPTASKSGRRIL